MDSRWQVFSLGKSDCLTQPVQMQLYQKIKISYQFLAKFLKATSNFEHFEKKGEPHRWFISEVIDCKKRGYINAFKAPCHNTYGQSMC